MKKVWRLLSMLIVLIVLVGIYIFAKDTPKKEETANNTEVKTIELLKLEKDKIKKVAIKSQDNEITIEKQGDKWGVTGTQFPIKQDSLNNVVTTLSSLNADKLIAENPSDLQQYGLDKGNAIVTATMDNGEEKTVVLGNETPGGSSSYVMLKGVNNVYTVSSTSIGTLTVKLDDIIDKSIDMVDTEAVNYLKIVTGGKTIELKPDQIQNSIGMGLNMFQYYSYPIETDGQKDKTLISALSSISVDEFVESNAKDLKKYGLDKPALQITAKDSNNKAIDILVGKNKDDSTVYFKMGSSGNVYTAAISQFDAFFNVKPFDLYDKFAYSVNIDSVDKIEIKAPSANYTMELSRETKKAENKDEKDTVVTTYKVNSNNVDESKFKQFYQNLIGLKVEAEKEKDVPEKPEVSIIYHFNTGADKVVAVTFTPYNDEFYSVYINGKSEFLISKSRVKDMLGSISF